ncbi:MAG TPA: sugar phosphate isomerase/epimerase [Solirubrobacterales bacterium]|jgi:sugar phosphate isomerase/epimerase
MSSEPLTEDQTGQSQAALSRRRFIGAAAGTAALGALAPLDVALAGPGKQGHGKGKGHGKGHGKDHGPHGHPYDADKGDIKPENVGIQLFTVRGLMGGALDLDGTFEMLSDAGYKTVEIGGTYDGRTPSEFRQLAEDFGLKVIGSHVPGGHNAFRNNLEQVLDEAETLGLPYVGIASPAGDVPRTADGYRAMAEEFNTYGEAAKARGITFYFHNHPGDFALDGGEPIYNVLLEETDPKLVWFEMDIAWVVAGGQDPYEYLKAAPHRFPLFHVKDLRFDPNGNRRTPGDVAHPNRPFFLTAVGKGEIDFPRIFSALPHPNRHEYLVEDDDAPDPQINPAGESNTAWVSREYLGNVKVRGRGRRR